MSAVNAAAPKTKPYGKGTRTIPAQRAAKYYPAVDAPKPKANHKVNKPTKLRASITPGTVLILLAGRFAGKRVVFLKQLASGLLLVTGPFKVNGVPLRRVNQAYVIATSTKLDVSGVSVPENVNDAYFAQEKARAPKPEQAFFLDPANKAARPEAKVADQKAVDQAVIAAAKKAGPTHIKYLATTFSLSNSDRPHAMNF